MSEKRILLVEDEAPVRWTLSANLELEGFSVLEAESAEKALELLETERVDIVLTDLRMPKMSGIDLARALRQTHPELPVVLLTAYTTEESVEQAIDAGVFTLLAKPCDIVSVVAAVTRAMQRPSVLVVDPAADSAEHVAKGLRAVGLAVETAHDAEGAISALTLRKVDVCVTELDLPGTASGSELLTRLRAVAPSLTLIVLSNRDARDLGPIARAGAHCVRKPPVPVHLARLIAEARRQ